MKKEDAEKYAQIAKGIAQFSKNKKLKVGALVIKDGRIVSTGYNGKLPGEPEPATAAEKQNTIHAELNAILNCAKHGISTVGCVMVITHHPCERCTRVMSQAGISEVLYIDDYGNEHNKIKKYAKMPIKKISSIKRRILQKQLKKVQHLKMNCPKCGFELLCGSGMGAVKCVECGEIIEL